MIKPKYQAMLAALSLISLGVIAHAVPGGPVVAPPDPNARAATFIAPSTYIPIQAFNGRIILYGIQLGNIGTAPAWAYFIDAASASDCSGTPVKRLPIPANPSPSGNAAGSNIAFPLGLLFTSGVTICVSTLIGGNTAPTASTVIVNYDYK